MTAGDVKAGLLLAGVAIAGYVGWRAYQAGGSILGGLKQAIDQANATAASAWQNNVAGPWAQGRQFAETGETPYTGSKAWLYSDAGYTGNDSNGNPVVEGEFYGDAVARRYAAEQRAAGYAPPAESINGAAFGVFPRATPGWFMTNQAANAARRTFASSDPRRLDF